MPAAAGVLLVCASAADFRRIAAPSPALNRRLLAHAAALVAAAVRVARSRHAAGACGLCHRHSLSRRAPAPSQRRSPLPAWRPSAAGCCSKNCCRCRCRSRAVVSDGHPFEPRAGLWRRADAEQPAGGAGRLHRRHRGRRAAGPRPDRNHQPAAADLGLSRPHQLDHPDVRHLLRRDVRRLDHIDPDQDPGRSRKRRDLPRRLPDGAPRPRRSCARHQRARRRSSPASSPPSASPGSGPGWQASP